MTVIFYYHDGSTRVLRPKTKKHRVMQVIHDLCNDFGAKYYKIKN